VTRVLLFAEASVDHHRQCGTDVALELPWHRYIWRYYTVMNEMSAVTDQR
jgi:hypothetical protein